MKLIEEQPRARGDIKSEAPSGGVALSPIRPALPEDGHGASITAAAAENGPFDANCTLDAAAANSAQVARSSPAAHPR